MKYNVMVVLKPLHTQSTRRYYADAVTVMGVVTEEVVAFSDPAGPGTAEARSFRSSERAFEASGEFEAWLILAFFFFLSKPEMRSLSDKSVFAGRMY